ncbi:TatD family hydrolase [Candidatus Woesearchaeota archaeon]|nr:TatD family hydrolase [Candidatus Woesearchaeota archaeon]
MLLADVHAHLDLIGENERKAVVERAIAAGVKVIISNSVDPKSIRKALELQQQFGVVKAALGLYPTEAARLPAAAIEGELNFIRSCRARIVALGEIGLDYQEAKGDRERRQQQRLFELQLGLAKELGKPAIVHSRQAEKGVVETLMRLGCKRVVLHAFHGSMKLVKAAAEAGFYVTIPTNIRRSSHFQAIARELPLSKLLTETDAPYLAAEKDGKSEPSHIAATVARIAAIKGMDAEEVANILYGNYQRLFS